MATRLWLGTVEFVVVLRYLGGDVKQAISYKDLKLLGKVKPWGFIFGSFWHMEMIKTVAVCEVSHRVRIRPRPSPKELKHILAS